MTDWNVAVVREQGQTFAVISVRESVINSALEREQVAGFWARELGCRVVLIGDGQGQAWGPRDIVGWLQGIHPSQLPWRRMTVPP